MLLYVFVKGGREKKISGQMVIAVLQTFTKTFQQTRPSTKQFGCIFVQWIVGKWYCHPIVKNLVCKVLLSALVPVGLAEVILVWIIFCGGHVQIKDELTSAFRRLFSHVGQ